LAAAYPPVFLSKGLLVLFLPHKYVLQQVRCCFSLLFNSPPFPSRFFFFAKSPLVPFLKVIFPRGGYCQLAYFFSSFGRPQSYFHVHFPIASLWPSRAGLSTVIGGVRFISPLGSLCLFTDFAISPLPDGHLLIKLCFPGGSFAEELKDAFSVFSWSCLAALGWWWFFCVSSLDSGSFIRFFRVPL